MNKVQAEIKAGVFNRMVKHPEISYAAVGIAPTKWERNRWCVVQRLGEHAVGIAAV